MNCITTIQAFQNALSAFERNKATQKPFIFYARLKASGLPQPKVSLGNPCVRSMPFRGAARAITVVRTRAEGKSKRLYGFAVEMTGPADEAPGNRHSERKIWFIQRGAIRE